MDKGLKDLKLDYINMRLMLGKALSHYEVDNNTANSINKSLDWFEDKITEAWSKE